MWVCVSYTNSKPHFPAAVSTCLCPQKLMLLVLWRCVIACVYMCVSQASLSGTLLFVCVGVCVYWKLMRVFWGGVWLHVYVFYTPSPTLQDPSPSVYVCVCVNRDAATIHHLHEWNDQINFKLTHNSIPRHLFNAIGNNTSSLQGSMQDSAW